MASSRTSAVCRLAALLPITLLALVLPPAAAQVPFLGGCPERAVVENFNVTAYLGKWYEQERYFAVFQLGGNCVTATYTDEGNGTVGVNNQQMNLISGKKSTIKGTARLAEGNSNGEAKLEVRFPSVGNFPAPYWVLDTDYDNYAIVWSCTGLIGISNVQFAWILTRAKNPSVDVLAGVRDSLAQRRFETLPFRRTLQVCEDN